MQITYLSLSLLASCALVGRVPAAQEATSTEGTPALTIEDTLRPLRATERAPRVRWSEDGRRVRVGSGGEAETFDPLTWEPVAPLPAPEDQAPSGGGDAGEEGASKPERSKFTLPDGARERHTSPQGDWRSYVLDGDLWLAPSGGGEGRRITRDGDPELLDGLLDWVYQEELYGRGDFQGHWWSPTGTHVAFLSLDERPVEDFAIVDHVPKDALEVDRGVDLEQMRYPKAGDPNPKVGLSIHDVESGETHGIDLGEYPSDILIARVFWAPEGDELWFYVTDRIQTWAEVLAVRADGSAPRRVLTERSESWVNRPPEPHWLSDGSFLWESERTGYNHLYRMARSGELLGAVTSGEWQVRTILRIDEERGQVWFEGTRDGAVNRNVYRAGWDGAEPVRLTRGQGTHEVQLSEDGSLFLDRFSAVDRVPEVRLCDGESGEVLRVVCADELDPDLRLASTRLFEVPARDGYPLDCTLTAPADFAWDAPQDGVLRPVYLATYSGPDAPTVRNAWRPSAWHQFLCEQGFLVLRCNVRSASGRGQVHTATCYQRLGEQELSDLEDAVAWTVAEYGGDPQRVAIAGWSYGGFMAGYALTHSNAFAIGFAGAGVHDWRLYDTIYTERYMRTPQENVEGYAATSVIAAAKDLSGHLVIQHGTMDDNVHLQNSIQLVDALQKAGHTSFDLMLYPNSRHGVRSKHKRLYEWRRLREVLLGAGGDG